MTVSSEHRVNATQRAIPIIAPNGERWIVTLDVFGRKCPGGQDHELCLEKPWTCPTERGGRRRLTIAEATHAVEAMGYEATT